MALMSVHGRKGGPMRIRWAMLVIVLVALVGGGSRWVALMEHTG